jgi:hypothetical protein
MKGDEGSPLSPIATAPSPLPPPQREEGNVGRNQGNAA